jgi:hypothetical protein
VPHHRARGIGYILIVKTSTRMRARTIRVVFAAKLLKKLISIHLVYLVLKLLSVPMPGQGRYTLTRLRVPDLNCSVPACACNFCAVWTVNHREDPAFR